VMASSKARPRAVDPSTFLHGESPPCRRQARLPSRRTQRFQSTETARVLFFVWSSMPILVQDPSYKEKRWSSAHHSFPPSGVVSASSFRRAGERSGLHAHKRRLIAAGRWTPLGGDCSGSEGFGRQKDTLRDFAENPLRDRTSLTGLLNRRTAEA